MIKFNIINDINTPLYIEHFSLQTLKTKHFKAKATKIAFINYDEVRD